MKLAVYSAMKAFQLVIILNSPPLRRYCDTMCPWPLAVNGKLRIDYQGVEICLERPWRRETMHNLVKEAGIDFKNFGDDLNAAKEHDIKQLIFLVMIWIRVQLKQCSSVGHLHNEVVEFVEFSFRTLYSFLRLEAPSWLEESNSFGTAIISSFLDYRRAPLSGISLARVEFRPTEFIINAFFNNLKPGRR
ncbi:hypothetical protein MTR67_018043 [Solanum verrucosum]|uniref:Uncharacterized protein n=1 Tax=Solanum verrucosum TaxID=315347 RepID=A0AAF0QK97_SOLVR|nr:hypothetical protein MTR67_018043 [Solanum verrucosum]